MWYYEVKKSPGVEPAVLKNMEHYKEDGYYRPGMMGSEIVWGDAKFKIPTREGLKNQKNMVIFSMVARNALTYLKSHQIKKSRLLPSEKWNDKIPRNPEKLIGTDVNHAYWTIAHKMKIISDNTYEKGLKAITNKAILLASLAALGSDKSYQVIKEGKLINKFVVLKGNDDLKEIYKSIRMRCFQHMNKLAALLGKDFICYKTDCIYYRNTNKNVEMVREYLERNGFTYKMLKPPSELKPELI